MGPPDNVRLALRGSLPEESLLRLAARSSILQTSEIGFYSRGADCVIPAKRPLSGQEEDRRRRMDRRGILRRVGKIASSAILITLVLEGGRGYSLGEQGEKGESPGYRIVVVKQAFKLRLYAGDDLVNTYPIAIGKNPGDKQEVGDGRTPEGDFYISKIQDSRDWVHDFQDGKGPIKGAYGPWFLRLGTDADRTRSGKAWSGIAIHGTHDPDSIGMMKTEGCVRMHDVDIEELKKLVRVGTRVSITP